MGPTRYEETILVWDEPKRWAYRVDAMTLPLARAQTARELHVGLYEVPRTLVDTMLNSTDCRIVLTGPPIPVPRELLWTVWADGAKGATAPRILEAEVTWVIDGDTVRVKVGGQTETVRYIGINAPEVSTPPQPWEQAGRDARDLNTLLVGQKKVRLELDTQERDASGRLLAYVYVGDAKIGAAGTQIQRGELALLTLGAQLPVTAGAFDTTFNGGVVDVFVAKLNADASGLVYATYLGGTPTPLRRGSGDPFEFGRGIAVDADGHAYVTGQTTSDDFPTTAGAFQTTINVTDNPNDATDGFVAKLTPTGSGLVYSTYLGGTNFDDTDGIALDAAGNAYVTGRTSSDDFPVTPGAFQGVRGGGFDGFVTKLNADGSDVVYSTYLGGADNEVTENVVVDAGGNAYVAGSSRSEDFPTTPGAFQPTHPGGDFVDLFTAFAVKLNPDGSELVYSTFLGGTKRDFASDIAVDADGHAWVSGATLSPEFPTTAGVYDTIFDGTSEIHFRNEDAHITANESTGWVVSREVLSTVVQSLPVENTLTAVNIYVLESGVWRIAHHHAAPVLAGRPRAAQPVRSAPRSQPRARLSSAAAPPSPSPQRTTMSVPWT